MQLVNYCLHLHMSNIKTNEIMRSTSHKVGQFYSFKNESASKIIEVRNGKYGNFIVLENGNTISVCR